MKLKGASFLKTCKPEVLNEGPKMSKIDAQGQIKYIPLYISMCFEANDWPNVNGWQADLAR